MWASLVINRVVDEAHYLPTPHRVVDGLDGG